MLDFACAFAGEGNPDARDEQLPIFEEVKRATLEALSEHNQLTQIAKLAKDMLEKCPADSDATQAYWEATDAFKDAVAKFNAKKPGAI